MLVDTLIGVCEDSYVGDEAQAKRGSLNACRVCTAYAQREATAAAAAAAE